MLSAPLLHGEVGFLDELILIACVVILFAVLIAFYVRELKKTKTTNEDEHDRLKP